MEINQINELATILKENQLTRLEVTEGNLHIIMERAVSGGVVSNTGGGDTVIVQNTQEQVVPVVATPMVVEEHEYQNTQKAPLVGTVYLAPKPGEATFVAIGQSVEKGDTICIIESMKMFNAIEAERSGRVTAILIEDGQVVEFGQDLIAIE